MEKAKRVFTAEFKREALHPGEKALQMALHRRHPERGLLHHSDRGIAIYQFAVSEGFGTIGNDREHEPNWELL